MTLRAFLVLAIALLLTGPVWAQAAKPAAKDPVIARVNGFDIHRSDIEDAARSLPPQMRQQPPNKLYSAILDQMVATTLVAQAARHAKVEDEPDVKRQLLLMQDQLIAQVYVHRLVQKNITEAKLKAAYDKYLKSAPPREEVSARHILLSSEADAKAVIAQLEKGADFAALAKEKTTDPAGKASGGELGWFTKDQMVPEFADAAFKLKKGEFTKTPVKTQFGWHVIKVEDRRVAKPPSLDELRPQLLDQLAHEVIGQKLRELKTAAKIEIFNPDGSKMGAPPAAAPGPRAAPGAAQGQGPLPELEGAAPGAEPGGVPVLSPATKPKD